MSDHPELIVGIDLGTTNSLIAWCDHRGPHVARDATGEARVPSVVRFEEDGSTSVGWGPRTHAVERPTTTVYSIKRLMGRGFQELSDSGELNHLPYRVIQRAGDTVGRDMAAVDVSGRVLTPPEISALVLRALKEKAEAELGQSVGKAVITVPAYFDDAQRQATRDAGRIAGLEVVRMINEPTAAAMAYGLGVREQVVGSKPRPQPVKGNSLLPLAGGGCATSKAESGEGAGGEESIVAVYDLGGGTFDVSILRLFEGVFEVLSTHGNTSLGGDDLDREIMALVYREIEQQFGLAVEPPATQQGVRLLAENVKIRLSEQDAADIEVDLGGGRIYRRQITRAEFEALAAPWIEKTIASCRQALRDAKLAPGQIDQVVMVGGSTRIPMVRRRVQEAFGRLPYTALNPDEVVALGAAVQAGILSGLRDDALLLDVIPLSLGIETMGGAMGKLILRNTRIPCQATERFSTFVDGQTSVKINVLQGERELARDCRSLGQFELRGLPPMPAGFPKLLVTFLVDENGILNVTALEERSRSQASIQIVPAHGLTPEEVARMERESIAHARDDLEAHRLIDLRNQIAFDTHKTEQMLARVGERLPPGERAAIEGAMAELRRLGEEGSDTEAIHRALTEFDRRTVHLAELSILTTLQQGQRPSGA